jgi:hypothetical protein
VPAIVPGTVQGFGQQALLFFREEINQGVILLRYEMADGNVTIDFSVIIGVG